MTTLTILTIWDCPYDCNREEEGAFRQSRRFGEVDAETATPALVLAGHLSARVAELLLHKTFVDLGRRGRAGAKGVTGKHHAALGFGQISTYAGRQSRALDETGRPPGR